MKLNIVATLKRYTQKNNLYQNMKLYNDKKGEIMI